MHLFLLATKNPTSTGNYTIGESRSHNTLLSESGHMDQRLASPRLAPISTVRRNSGSRCVDRRMVVVVIRELRHQKVGPIVLTVRTKHAEARFHRLVVVFDLSLRLALNECVPIFSLSPSKASNLTVYHDSNSTWIELVDGSLNKENVPRRLVLCLSKPATLTLLLPLMQALMIQTIGLSKFRPFSANPH